MERTLILLKPDAVERGLMGRLLTRFEEKGLRVVGCKMLKLTSTLAMKHYEEHKSKSFFTDLIEFITHGPVMVLCLEGLEVITVCRSMIGATTGTNADPGTIRGDFAQYRSFNLIHGSDSYDAARREISLFFNADELLDYDKVVDIWHFGPQDD